MERAGYQEIDKMYGLASPKPEAPTYTVEERALMALREEQRVQQQRATDRAERAWQAIEVRRPVG